MEIKENTQIRFKPKPLAISVSYRMHTKLALIVMILKLNSRDTKASALKMQFFIWALKDSNNRKRVRDLVASNFTTNLEFWGLEPALSRALDYAVSESLVTIDNGLYKLAPKGEEYVTLIQKEMEVFPIEKSFLVAIGKRISDSRLAKIATWAQQDVEN